MGFHALKWAFNVKAGGPADKAVLLVLAKHANDLGICYPGARTISVLACCSEKTVLRALRRLEQRGLILRRTRYRQDGTRSTDLVMLSVPPKSTGQSGLEPPDSQSYASGHGVRAESETDNRDFEVAGDNVVRIGFPGARRPKSRRAARSSSLIDAIDRRIASEASDDTTE